MIILDIKFIEDSIKADQIMNASDYLLEYPGHLYEKYHIKDEIQELEEKLRLTSCLAH